jgi:hypothetical protein
MKKLNYHHHHGWWWYRLSPNKQSATSSACRSDIVWDTCSFVSGMQMTTNLTVKSNGDRPHASFFLPNDACYVNQLRLSLCPPSAPLYKYVCLAFVSFVHDMRLWQTTLRFWNNDILSACLSLASSAHKTAASYTSLYSNHASRKPITGCWQNFFV